MFPQYSFHFPKELEWHILNLLQAKDILQRVSSVSKHWRKLSNNENLWQNLYLKNFSLELNYEISWKKKFQETFESLIVVDQIYEEGNYSFEKLDESVKALCQSIGIFVMSFKWVRTSKIVEVVPFFLISRISEGSVYVENNLIKTVKTFQYSLMLANQENFKTLLLEKKISLRRHVIYKWPALFIQEALALRRINTIEMLLNDRFRAAVENAYQHNYETLLNIENWTGIYKLFLDENCKILDVQSVIGGKLPKFAHCSILLMYYERDDKDFLTWKFLDDRWISPKQEAIIYQVMNRCLCSLLEF